MNHEAIHPKKTFKSNLRSIFLRGLAVLFPIYLTILLLQFLIHAMSKPVAPLVRWIIGTIEVELSPGITELIVQILSFIITLGLIAAIGIITGIVIGKKFVSYSENLLSRLPVVRTIYKTFKEITSIVTGQSAMQSNQVVAVKLPQNAGMTLGFVTGKLDIGDGETKNLIFVPTVPNISSGFLLLLNPDQYLTTRLTSEQAVRLVISAGILNKDD